MRVLNLTASAAIIAVLASTSVHAEETDYRLIAKAVLSISLGHEPTNEQIETTAAEEKCLDKAIERFSPQQETATVVADTVMKQCTIEMMRSAKVMGHTFANEPGGLELLENIHRPEIVAQIMRYRTKATSSERAVGVKRKQPGGR